MIKITLSGEIGWEIYPEDIRQQLRDAKGKDIEVHMVSPGGSVMDGIEIFNLFRDFKRENPDSQNILIIKGMAASMATYLAMNPAFDLVAAEDNAVFMIHNAWGVTSGDYRDMRLFAEILDGLTDIIGKEYARKTKIKIKEIREMMDAETWLFGSEIMDAGFIDEMIPADNPKKKKSKAEALALAKLKYSTVSDKMKSADNQLDVHKIAAMIKPAEPETPTEPIADDHETSNYIEKLQLKLAQIPAKRENYISEAKTMNLAQFLAENPAAKIEHDAALSEQFNAGILKGHESMQIRMKAAAAFLGPDSVYPGPIKGLAIDVLDGKQTPEALQAAAATYDALKESKASDDAAAETKNQGPTPAEQTPAAPENGQMKTDADFNAEVEQTKIDLGMEV